MTIRKKNEEALRRSEEGLRALNADLERKVSERTAELAAANRELEAFAYSVSHDLRAPLRAINGFAVALAEDCAPALGDVGRGHLDRIRAGSDRMDELIRSLLELSRITRAELERAGVDLSSLAAAVGSDLAQSNRDRKVELVVAPGLRVDADPALLRVVLTNLLGNAWKFTGHTASPRVEVGVIAEGPEAPVYFVRDNGAGFDMRYAGQLFGAFQRLHSSREFPGTGIGLATVQRVVHRHGGRVWAEAALDRGATFYFTLPSSSDRATRR
jgi:light-regulated signal transduction histidine kinase (bacteriophytochrome)